MCHIFAYIITKHIAKYNKVMRVSKLILNKIKHDLRFRLNVALALNVTERQVHNLVDNNSDSLTKYKAVEYYKSQGFKESEIFEKEEISK